MSDHCPHDDDAVSWKRSPYGRSYRVCGECESERDPRAPAREQAEPTPIRMEGARSVCYRAGRESVVRDWPSVEEAASLPLPCGPGCRGVHVVVSVVDGRWRVRSPRPAPPELSDLYRWTAPAKAVDEPRRWPTPFGLNGPLRRGQPWPPLPPDPDAVRRPTAALGGMTRRGLTAVPTCADMGTCSTRRTSMCGATGADGAVPAAVPLTAVPGGWRATPSFSVTEGEPPHEPARRREGRP
jgi:hypothetical protein